MKISLFIILFISFCAEAWEVDLPIGKSGQIIQREGYSLRYNSDCKIPHWVSYVISKDSLTGNISRTNDFREDSELRGPQASLEDYRRSGYNRGHMARAGLYTTSRKLKSESFILSNIVPQEGYMNQNGAWRKAEDFEEDSIVKFGEIQIISGPVLDGNMQRIGPNEVCVPNYLFKVLYRGGRNPQGIAFIIPNFRTSEYYRSYAVSIDEVERLTGLDFLSNLSDREERAVEASFDFSQW